MRSRCFWGLLGGGAVGTSAQQSSVGGTKVEDEETSDANQVPPGRVAPIAVLLCGMMRLIPLPSQVRTLCRREVLLMGGPARK